MCTVLIVGASRGIGLALVRQHAQAGDRVIATARDAEGLGRIAEAGGQALRIDVAQPASVSALAWQLDEEKIDVAYYVAGITDRADAATPPTQDAFDRVMHTNVLGAMQVIPQVAPLVEAAGGKFIFLSSIKGRIGGPQDGSSWLYRVSKAALNMAVVAAQPKYPGAVMVSCHPGWVQTEMGGSGAQISTDDSAQALRQLAARLTPDDRGTYWRHDGTRFESW